MVISIRTPAWGVTVHTAQEMRAVRISIRTPAWGVTIVLETVSVRAIISIRTPAWGVTILEPPHRAWHLFQFAPPRGG